MKREIKFRGKTNRMNGSAWIYGDLRHHKNDVYIFKQEGNGGEQVNRDTIGQFTGLFDKNGKEIYEGDIVRYWQEDTRCTNPDCILGYEPFIKEVINEVSFEDGMFVSFEDGLVCDDFTPLVWSGISNLKELRDSLDVIEEDGWRDDDGNIIDESVLGIEVIGNIYDNPELLEK